MFANYLVEIREEKERIRDSSSEDIIKVEAKAVLTFSAWLEQRREIRTLLGKRSLE